MTCPPKFETQYTALLQIKSLSCTFKQSRQLATMMNMVAPLLFCTVVLIFQTAGEMLLAKRRASKPSHQEASENVPPSNNQLGDEVPSMFKCFCEII